MKVEVKKTETFKPIKLTVTIESEQEFCNLYHRINAASNIINEAANELVYQASYQSSVDLWNTLNNLLNNEYKYLKTK